MSGISFRAIVPHYSNYTSDKARLHIYTYMKQTGEAVKKDFQATAIGWKTKPEFYVHYHSPSGGIASFEVGTDDTLWHYLDKGVKPHMLGPKPGHKAISFIGTHSYIRRSQGETFATYASRESTREATYGTAFKPKQFLYKKKGRKVFKTKISPVTLGGPYAGRVPVSKPFMWPGIEARNWTAAIDQKWRTQITKSFRNVIMEEAQEFANAQYA